jgi:hypothetical protein
MLFLVKWLQCHNELGYLLIGASHNKRKCKKAFSVNVNHHFPYSFYVCTSELCGFIAISDLDNFRSCIGIQI